MLKTIKFIIKIWKEDIAKNKAYRKLVSQMTLEEYKYFKGASAMMQQRKSFIDYSKSQCSSIQEYNKQTERREYKIVGIKERPTIRRCGPAYYADNSRYEVYTHTETSINEKIHAVETSKDFKKVQTLCNKYN